MKKAKMEKRDRHHWEGTVLADEACPNCRNKMKERKSSLKSVVNGEDVMVPAASHLECPKCREQVLRFDEARHFREKALDLYRKKYRLLSADEIRSIRERLGLTQRQLATILRLGDNTISRWESGRNVQAAALDVLLRLLRDLPGSLDYLKRRAA